MKRYTLIVKGLVQGVGFRPFVYNLAKKLDLKGEVYNNSLGVVINLDTTKEKLESFMEYIKKEKPILSEIDFIEVLEKHLQKPYDDFNIIQSEKNSKIITTMPLDTCMCEDCKKELYDKNNRRYLYPFINCTNCGPRYTLIKKLPYDRKDTSMDPFIMCDSCKKEYTDPTNRRYHAQITACAKCGPKLSLKDKNKTLNILGDKIIEKAVNLLKEGNILAVKGIGGFHLMCDAKCDEAIKNLRDRKNRPHKPFAVMVKDIFEAKRLAKIDKNEEKLLISNKRPIVLLNKLNDYNLSPLVAPLLDKIGLFLPYTPLHHMIMEKFDSPLIATSANNSGDPICISSEDIKQINHIWDYCIDHDREILNGCDDSVTAAVEDEVLFLRSGRGYAPLTFSFDKTIDKNILSLGANQKSTIALAYENKVVVSPYLGDLDTLKSIQKYRKTVDDFKTIYDFEEDILVCDKHEGYESTKYAKELKKSKDILNLIQIQHHRSHIVAVMTEKNIRKKVLGLAFDGTGLGEDGTLWGGEFFYGDENEYERVAYFKPFKLLGGSLAIKEPKRCALSFMFEIYGKKSLDIQNNVTKQFSQANLKLLYQSWEKNINSPLTSSVGRIFDAVSSIADIVHEVSYEGQSGSQTESYFDENIKQSYPFFIKNGVIDIEPMIKQMFLEENKTLIVSKFFNTLSDIIKEVCKDYQASVILSGGVFQNIALTKLLKQTIPNVVFSTKLACNDASISFGQIGCLKEN